MTAARPSGLDPDARRLLDVAAASGEPPFHTLPVVAARTRLREIFVTDARPTMPVEDLTIPGPAGGIPIRVYHPAPGATVPALLYFHGGGWVLNDLDTHDRLCSALAATSGVAVVAVDYRLAPEHRYPAALDDAYTALTWLSRNAARVSVDPRRVAVGGDSTGATIATALGLLTAQRHGPEVELQLLFYPVTDALHPRSASVVERATGYSLTTAFLSWAWEHYLPFDWRRDDPYLFPLRATDLSALPPTFILTAEYDPLRDEGVAYAERLAAAGVPTQHWHLDDQMHGFAMQTASIRRAAEIVAEVGETLKSVLVQRREISS